MAAEFDAKTPASPTELAESTARVRMMEALFDRLSHALDNAPGSLDGELQAAARSLAAYQSGGDWLHDYVLDEAGLFPPELKRGVLSQDALYELLCREEFKALLSDGESTQPGKARRRKRRKRETPG